MKETSQSLTQKKTPEISEKPSSERRFKEIQTSFGDSEPRDPSRRVGSGTGSGIKYQATQVILRSGGDPDRALPIGTSAIGRLLSAIDTREPSPLVKVILPYGVSFNHERKIDRGAVLFGTVTYPGQGDKAYIRLSRLLLPDGKELRIDAQVLSSVDYSPGVYGEVHGAGGERIATTLGLTMLSGVTETLVEREAIGQAISATPKASLRNGFYNGLTRATESEAERLAGKVMDQNDFLTIESGQDVIVSLTETFRGENL